MIMYSPDSNKPYNIWISLFDHRTHITHYTITYLYIYVCMCIYIHIYVCLEIIYKQ